jgi:soluble lytic murein transglycosylase-like protein
LDVTDSHVLTTYAGLLLRDLLDRFNGDIEKAVGAYNGGPRNPNAEYAAGVQLVAVYARNFLSESPQLTSRLRWKVLSAE